MDKLKKIFGVNDKIFVFLFCLMIVAVIFGSCFPLFLSSTDRVMVSDYLSGFVEQVYSYNCSFSFFKNSILSNGLFLTLIHLLGISMVGIPIILFLFFYKCFIFGFSISSIIINYGVKGVLFGLFYIFPHQVINIFLFLILTSCSLSFSFKLFGFLFKKFEFNIRIFFYRYFYVLIIVLFLFLISSLYEAFISPYILKFIFGLLGL